MVEPTPNWDSSNTIESQWSHYVIFGCSVFALGWGAINALKVREIKLEEENIRVNTEVKEDAHDLPKTAAECKARMIKT